MPLSPNFGGDVSGFGKRDKRGSKPQIFPARVKDIILQPSTNLNSLFIQNKGYPSIGYISFHPLYSVIDSENKANLVASPLDINVRRVPLINEVVLIIQSTDVLNEDPQSQKYYYLSGVNIWNSVHHNGFPDLQNLSATQKSEVLLGYLSTENGLTKKPDDSPKDLFLGNTFIENPEIRNLLPLEGDTLVEGRFGNSIRLSHTAISPSQSVVSPWSKAGNNTQPITIIRNGQTKQTPSIRWTPIFEDINGDASSIYLTNGQEIQMTLASSNLASYGTAPTASVAVVTVPNVIIQPANKSVITSDEEELFEAADVEEEATQTPPPAPPLNPTGSSNSTTNTPPPSSSVSPTVKEQPPTSGPGSSKENPLPESQLGALTWAGEEIAYSNYAENYSDIEEDESQYWDKNPPTIEIPAELAKFITPSPPPRIVPSTDGTGGNGIKSTPLTPEEIAEAKRIAEKAGLDIIPGQYTNNAGQKITLACVGSQTLELEAAKAYLVMVAAAKADDVEIRLSSGFRPPLEAINVTSTKGVKLRFTSQLQLRTKDRWKGGKCGEFTEQARLTAGSSCFAPATAPPGKSLHGNGVAIDINTGGFSAVLPSTGALTPVYVWMAVNGWKYGFVRAVRSETWHYEYWPSLAKSGPYAKLGGKPDANYQRTMSYKGQNINLAQISV